MPLNRGGPFPQAVVRTADGDVDLAERWSTGPLVVAFHRLWCPFCHQSANELAAALRGVRARRLTPAHPSKRTAPRSSRDRCNVSPRRWTEDP